MKHYISFDLMSKAKQDVAFEKLLAYIYRAGEGKNKKQMSKTLRAKFKVAEVTDFGSYDGGKTPNLKVKLVAVYSHDKASEDNQFSQATPSGDMWMMITNPAAQGFFEPGKSYYLDISKEDQE